MNNLKHLGLILASTVPIFVIDALALVLIWTGSRGTGFTIAVSLLVYVLAVTHKPSSHQIENSF